MFVKVRLADSYADTELSTLSIIRVDSIYYDTVDSTFNIDSGEATYCAPMTRERYDDACESIFHYASTHNGYVDLTFDVPVNTFITFPDDWEDEGRYYLAALESLLS